MPPFSWFRCWSPSALCLWRGKNKGTVGRVTGVAQRPHLVPGCLPWGQGSSDHLVVRVPHGTAHEAPGAMLAPKTQSMARAEEGLGQVGRPKYPGKECQGCGFRPTDPVLGTERGSSMVEVAPLCSSQSPELPSQRRGQPALPPQTLGWNIHFYVWGPGVGRAVGCRATGARLW